ncbi:MULTISPECIES: HpsJ-like protein, cyanoexosortase A-associated [Brasilonema]|uniref:HpsJ-like protein, cyanoexosortase A-associated n=1 Tax=Brasilonema TaxID=383614 RepID=UPI00155A4C63|nr:MULTISPECIES: HpsJ family protein [Brasilonema]
MTKSNSDKFIPVVQELQDFAFSQQGSMTIVRSLGYGLLLLALFDIIEMFIPPNFMNPVWEFQTMGMLVEKVPVPLIGLVLVFFGELHSRTKLEIPVLKFLSWLTLLLGILFFLLIPLGLVSTIRLNSQNAAQVKTVSTQQIYQAEQLEQQVTKASPEQIDKFFKSQGRKIDKNPQELKEQLLSDVSKAKQEIKTQAEATQSLRGLSLIKTSVKWNLGAVVAGTLFISIWKGTRWARN